MHTISLFCFSLWLAFSLMQRCFIVILYLWGKVRQATHVAFIFYIHYQFLFEVVTRMVDLVKPEFRL